LSGAIANLFIGFVLMIGLIAVPILVNVRQEDVSDLRGAALSVGLLLSTAYRPDGNCCHSGRMVEHALGLPPDHRDRVVDLDGGLRAGVANVDAHHFGFSYQLANGNRGHRHRVDLLPISASAINSADSQDRGWLRRWCRCCAWWA
jgi:hypothetical protein